MFFLIFTHLRKNISVLVLDSINSLSCKLFLILNRITDYWCYKSARYSNFFCSQTLISSKHPDIYTSVFKILNTFFDILLKQIFNTGSSKQSQVTFNFCRGKLFWIPTFPIKDFHSETQCAITFGSKDLNIFFNFS